MYRVYVSVLDDPNPSVYEFVTQFFTDSQNNLCVQYFDGERIVFTVIRKWESFQSVKMDVLEDDDTDYETVDLKRVTPSA